ncbi:MAG: hypothetical protein MI784_09250, partial [Cytophagales bacterium]|nr:hypothetical protein [Cytophagales bacterium]
EQRFLASHIQGARFAAIDSDYGHDGFLLENEQLTEVIKKFYDESPLLRRRRSRSAPMLKWKG